MSEKHPPGPLHFEGPGPRAVEETETRTYCNADDTPAIRTTHDPWAVRCVRCINSMRAHGLPIPDVDDD